MPGLNLSRTEAKDRAEHLYVNSYAVTLDVTKGEETFYSKSEVSFTCNKPGYSTFIDAVGRSVISATLNGAAVDVSNFDGESIFLTNLAADNTLVIEIEAEYSKSGEGLQRSVDPADGEIYLYSQGETAHIRNMFACFDQPSLKATFTLTVTTPGHWQAVSNNPVESKTIKGESVEWKFTTTPRIPTYLDALIAGPYSSVHDVYKGKKEIPLGIYCRKSMMQYLDPEDIFLITKQGFEYFEKVFGLAYPFEKYDQIAVVDFNFGAMENAGAVTFREDVLVFRSHMPEKAYLSRANTILHEMAHMWFGDMVTMFWWDDLWLNESFAEWASYLALSESTRFKGAWTEFNSARKNWAYRQDQLSSTHPIIADMVDMEAVNANFDGITYAKGASVLHQLVAHVGRPQFIAGLQKYFAKHAWGNTTLNDLLVELEAASGRKLDTWVHTWLQTAGVNTLRPQLEIDGDVYKNVVISQEVPLVPAGSKELRPHRLAVGLYDISGDSLNLRKSVELDVVGASTRVKELSGEKVADLLLINDRDLSYAKLRFDDRSIATLKKYLGRLNDPLARALSWASIWDMHRDAQISSADFIEIALSGLAGENDDAIVNIVIGQLGTSVEAYASDANRDKYREKLAAGFWNLMQSSAPASDLQLLYSRAFAANAHTPEQIKNVRGILNGEIKGLKVDTDRRWDFLIALTERGATTQAELDAELASDNTTSGNLMFETAKAATPSAEAKAYAFNTVMHQDAQTSVRSALVAGFQRPIQRHLLTPFVDLYFENLLSEWESKSYEGAAKFVTGMYPSWIISQSTLDKTNTWLNGVGKDAPAVLRKLVKESQDGVIRALKVQALDN
ncbi:MAG: aminopeptidase N [Actinobacteria bacterium]|nr:aminopeptidase N [Actinomycetota bacterium]NCX37850.1 aminopeptidase N [Actinomycetota bacterium]NCX39295.1 aminopeptidase N [Actinomycetota bacterium]